MTEIKNTLFRFATMRSPALLDQQLREKYFVYHPDPLEEGHFSDFIADDEIIGVSERIAAGQTAAATFTPLASKEALKTYVSADFYNFSGWLAKSAASLQTSLTPLDTTGYDELTPLTSTQLLNIWDNLFYQLLKNTAADLREQLLEILVAQHFIAMFEPGTPDAKIALSTVVVPKEFYGFNALPSPAEPPTPVVYIKDIEKDTSVVVAKDKAARHRTLVKELKNAQEKYEATYRKDFNDAKVIYENARLADMLEKITQDEETGDTKYDFEPFEPFEFTAADQITTTLINTFSEPSRMLANQLSLALLDTFEEAITRVNKEIALLEQQAFDKNYLSSKLVNLNNVLIPVGERIITPGHEYSFYMEPVKIAANLFKVFLSINTELSDADVVAADYSVVYHSLPTVASTSFYDQSYGRSLVVELFSEGIYIEEGSEIYESNFTTIAGTLTLKNKTTLTFSAITHLAKPTKGKMEVTLGDGSVDPVPGNPTYVPSGFGIRRLGIADYRQVEQTTCCYVPGEVSHIENVMAREYKEKSNRRLRRSEDTLTVERQTEKEDLTDTSSTERYEMQQQVSSVINKDVSASINTNSNVSLLGGSTSLGTSFAFNTSQQQSNSQAVSYAQDITQRAQERVIQKVREERVLKIVDEFEEQTKHGFDNRKGNQHVSGVYRWVDKIYNNRIFNYGKRLLYEFVIPQPSVFHTEAMKTISNSPAVTVLEKPTDPRTRDLTDYRRVVDSTAANWAAVYNTEIEAVPEATMRISKAIQLNSIDVNGAEQGAKADKIELPEGYKAVSAVVNYMFYYHPSKKEFPHVLISVGDKKTPLAANDVLLSNTVFLSFDQPIHKEVGVGIEAGDMSAVSCTVTLNCIRTDQFYAQWQLNSFNAIIEGYEKKLAAYNDAIAAAQAPSQQDKQANPLFYRQIENMVLRKNCVSYLVGQNEMGKKFYKGSTVQDLQSVLDSSMDEYASMAKFIEQAFEWDIMSYTFYPFYWADKAAWHNLYQVEVNDALFRSFLQAGLARVVVTVRPGFEEAVMHYMATRQVWNGGQVPVIGDDLYLSIVDELKNPNYYVEETWETRVPTTLTVIQAGNIGLESEGLPCCHDGEETEIVANANLLAGMDSEEEGG